MSTPKSSKGHAEPEKPWPALAPSALSFVKDDSPHWRIDGVDGARNQQDGTCSSSRDAIDIGVKLKEIERDHTKDELAAHLARCVAEAHRQHFMLLASLKGH